MSLNDEERALMVALELERARKLIVETEKISDLGMWNTAASRLYYALFHAVSDLLINDERPVCSHKGVNLRFGQHYVQTGIFTAEDGRLYTQLQSLRERADYNILFEASEEDVRQMLPPVKSLLKRIEQYLS